MLALALKGIEPELKFTLLGALPKRMSSAIETQVEAIGSVPLSQATTARRDVMDLAKKMMIDGDIELQLFEEQVVE